MKKSLRCWFGFHDLSYDTVGNNVGSEATPVYVLWTYLACHRCGHREPAYR